MLYQRHVGLFTFLNKHWKLEPFVRKDLEKAGKCTHFHLLVCQVDLLMLRYWELLIITLPN